MVAVAPHYKPVVVVDNVVRYNSYRATHYKPVVVVVVVADNAVRYNSYRDHYVPDFVAYNYKQENINLLFLFPFLHRKVYCLGQEKLIVGIA